MSETIEAVEAVKPKPAMIIPIEADSKEIGFTNHVQLKGFIDTMIKAKAVPKHLTTSDEVICAWNYAAQLKLPPQASLRNIAVIEGTPSLFGDLPLALAQRHSEYMYYSEFVIDSNYQKICFENKNLDAEIFAAVVLLQRKGMKDPESFSFSVKDAKDAGIYKLKTAKGYDTVWAKYPKDMLIRKARIRALRALFADALSGAGIAEDWGMTPDLDVSYERDVTDEPKNSDLLDRAKKISEEGSPITFEEVASVEN